MKQGQNKWKDKNENISNYYPNNSILRYRQMITVFILKFLK